MSFTVVDQDDNPIGAKEKHEVNRDDIYRVAALWMSDKSTGDVLLAQRKWTKAHDPGKWGAAVAGTVESHESYETNIVKEIEEEIGLTDLVLVPGPKVFTDHGKHRFFCQWYFAQVDKNSVDIKIQIDEVEAIKWVPLRWLVNDVRDNPPMYVPSTQQVLRDLDVI